MGKKSLKDLHPSLKQVPFRLHKSDWLLLRKQLLDDGARFQTIVTAFIEAYMKRDPLALKLVDDYRKFNDIPQVHGSQRPAWRSETIPPAQSPTSAHPSDSPHKVSEAKDIFDEIAKGSGV